MLLPRQPMIGPTNIFVASSGKVLKYLVSAGIMCAQNTFIALIGREKFYETV